MSRLAEMLAGPRYVAYAYAYPHKTAYRPLTPAIPLSEVWAAERRDSLFLYLHVPFCGMRCGFCNLFTQARPKAEFAREYLTTLRRQAGRVRSALDAAGGGRFARAAVGGGTPTYLEPAALEDLFDVAGLLLGPQSGRIPTGVEVSPETADDDRLAVLRRRGVTRVSIGVQSFVEAETAAVGRPQDPAVVRRALERLRATGFPVLNIDLMYGLPGQMPESWDRTLGEALAFAPEEVYLYPTYVRPLTGLGNSRRRWDDERLGLYRRGRGRLLASGYRQVSMRMFRSASAPADAGPAYCCQDDGMVGLGCGARSYSRTLHWSGEYAVGAKGVSEILTAWVARTDSGFDSADFGFRLDGDEQRRRYVIQSILSGEGLFRSAYRGRFGADPFGDLPQLAELERHSLAVADGDGLRLTEAGLEHSDVIGPWLASDGVRRLTEEYRWR